MEKPEFTTSEFAPRGAAGTLEQNDVHHSGFGVLREIFFDSQRPMGVLKIAIAFRFGTLKLD